MELSEKDRKPVATGNRSFFQVKHIVIIVSVLVGLLLWYGSQLVVAINPEQGKTPVIFTTYTGDTWKIQFTHSVEKTPVEEYFTVNGVNDLTMTHTIFESFGWGFPYSSVDGKISSTADGKFKLIMNRPYRNIKMRVAVQARPCIIHENITYHLCELFGQGTLIEVKVQHRYEHWLDNLL